MNIVDCLAIAPYYLDLFFAPPPALDPALAKASGSGPPKEEEEENMMGDVGKIMQVQHFSRLFQDQPVLCCRC